MTPAPESLALADALFDLINAKADFDERPTLARPILRLATQAYADAVVAVVRKGREVTMISRSPTTAELLSNPETRALLHKVLEANPAEAVKPLTQEQVESLLQSGTVTYIEKGQEKALREIVPGML